MLASTTDSSPSPSDLGLDDVADVQGKGYSSALFYDNGGVVTALGDGKGGFTYVVGLPAPRFPCSTTSSRSRRLQWGRQAGPADRQHRWQPAGGAFQRRWNLSNPGLGGAARARLPDQLRRNRRSQWRWQNRYCRRVCGGCRLRRFGHHQLRLLCALGKGDGTFLTPTFTAYGSELYAVTLADMNRDGNLDLLLDDAPFQSQAPSPSICCPALATEPSLLEPP